MDTMFPVCVAVGGGADVERLHCHKLPTPDVPFDVTAISGR